jgi:hypothetical protein
MRRRRAAYAVTTQVRAAAALLLNGLIERMHVRPTADKATSTHRSSERRAFPNLFALLLLASLACSFADNLINPGSFQTVNGPILAVVTAASLDPQGQLVNQTTSFPPTAPQMTVVVQVGQLASRSSLTVAWYSVGDAGDQKLFEHTIEVDPLDRAYSIGQNAGVLATGTYKAVATLGSATQTITWTVAEVQAPPSTSTSSTSNAAQTQSGKPPTSGTSGKVPASQGASGQTAAGGCTAHSWSDQFPPSVFVAASIPTTAQCMSIPSDLQLQVQIGNNPPKTVCSGSPGGMKSKSQLYPGEPIVLVCDSAGDPCKLNGGSDLPGTVLNASLVQQNGGQVLATNSLTLDPDTVPPRVTLTTNPSNGVKVKAGDKIQLTGIAEELKNAGWQTGVQKIEIWQTAPTSEQEVIETYNSFANKSCGAKSWKQTMQAFTYTVPNNPPASITFCAYATDFAGNEAKSDNCATFYTGLFTIKGSWQNHLLVNSNGHATLDQVANFTASGQPDNTMKGNVQVTTIDIETGIVGCPDFTTGNLNWTAVLSGTYQKNSDGSLTVSLTPTPQQGPSYYPPVDSVIACGSPGWAPQAKITVLPSSMGGTLINGKFDFRRDDPGAAATGYHYVTGHIEMVPNP